MSRQMDNRPKQRRPGRMGPGFGMPVEKAKDFKGSFKRLVSYLKPHRINLIIVLIFAIASTTFSIAAPKITAKATNKLQDGYMARMMLTQNGNGQKDGLKNIEKMMAQSQLKVQTDTQPNTQPNTQPDVQLDEKSISAIQEFMMLPKLTRR